MGREGRFINRLELPTIDGSGKRGIDLVMEWSNPAASPPPFKYYIVEAKYKKSYNFSDPKKVDLSNPLTKKTLQMTPDWRLDRIENLPNSIRIELETAGDHGKLLGKIDRNGNVLINLIVDINFREIIIKKFTSD